ncbi:MAG: hypothetical protein PUP92_28605 [Rhizonema sp. PD38]|nr:hypothetical protein [Rhizonema sp. PD38]
MLVLVKKSNPQKTFFSLIVYEMPLSTSYILRPNRQGGCYTTGMSLADRRDRRDEKTNLPNVEACLYRVSASKNVASCTDV